ncbi:MAG: class I SAM-dependent methyltransferase [Thermonemataceae bacterium]|nr:class I SAM-dependent methyltransferase [Thermonemataceae bacterium]
MFRAYLKYWWIAKDEHSIHSPFVFEFYQNVIKDKRSSYYAFAEIENLRKKLLQSQDWVEVEDFGAGSKKNKSPMRKVATITKNATKNPQIAQMLFRLVNFLQPQTLLDLGTCLGITTSYLAKAAPKDAKIYTFEGAENLLNLAKKNTELLHIQSIDFVLGNIDETLPKVLKKITQVDFAFIDANHRYEPTKRYFELILEKTTENSVLIFDDIYWSEEMTKAWNEIKAHPKVQISIDLFWVGIVFFRNKQPKQHFTLKF